MNEKPSLGRIVHLAVDKEDHRAAIIVAVHSEERVSLEIFGTEEDRFKTFVKFSAECEPGTWHWPERV